MGPPEFLGRTRVISLDDKRRVEEVEAGTVDRRWASGADDAFGGFSVNNRLGDCVRQCVDKDERDDTGRGRF